MFYQFFQNFQTERGGFVYMKSHSFQRLLFVLLTLFSLPVSAQRTSLSEILEASKANYPLLKSKQAAVKSAESKWAASKVDYLPSLIVGDQYTFASGNNVNGAFLPNEGTVFSPSGGIRPENIYKGVFGTVATAMVDWKFFNFGKVKANVKATQADITRNQADYENELFQHQIKIADAYLLLLINQKLVDAQQHNLERANIFKKVTDAAVESGMRPGIDSALASAEYAKAQMLLLESRRAAQTQLLRLSELSGELNENIQIDTLQFYTSLPASQEAMTTLAKNPSLRFAQSNIDLAEARSMVVKKSYLPSISLTAAGWGRGSGFSNEDGSVHQDFGSGTNFQVYNYLFGVSTRWNLTNIIRTKKDYQSEQFQVERFKELYNTQKLQLDRQSREAQLQLQLSLEQAKLVPFQLNAARTAFNQAEARYQSGLADLFTLAQSVNSLNRAEVDKYITYGNAWRSLLMNAAASGDLSLFLNQIK